MNNEQAINEQTARTIKAMKQRFRFIGRAEVDELARILVPGEVILESLNGFYSGGFALIVATNMRLLLVDKKPFMLNVSDLRYDMITEVDYNARLLDASATIHTPSKKLIFTSWRHRNLRSLTSFVQRHIMLIRQQVPGAMSVPYAAAQQPQVQAYDQPSVATPALTPLSAGPIPVKMDEASARRFASILRRPRVGKFLLSQ